MLNESSQLWSDSWLWKGVFDFMAKKKIINSTDEFAVLIILMKTSQLSKWGRWTLPELHDSHQPLRCIRVRSSVDGEMTHFFFWLTIKSFSWSGDKSYLIPYFYILFASYNLFLQVDIAQRNMMHCSEIKFESVSRQFNPTWSWCIKEWT